MKNNSSWLWLVAAMLLTACAGIAPTPNDFPPPPPEYMTSAALTRTPIPGGVLAGVTRVIDGDTIDVSLDGQAFRVRYIGVNTPESVEPCFREATAANMNLVYGRAVMLVKDVSDTDKYDRLLRYVYVGDTFVNSELVRQGWAEAVSYPPDTAQEVLFNSLEDAARAGNLGCWSSGVFDK